MAQMPPPTAKAIGTLTELRDFGDTFWLILL
jgi:hypothetical protein